MRQIVVVSLFVRNAAFLQAVNGESLTEFFVSFIEVVELA